MITTIKTEDFEIEVGRGAHAGALKIWFQKKGPFELGSQQVVDLKNLLHTATESLSQ